MGVRPEWVDRDGLLYFNGYYKIKIDVIGTINRFVVTNLKTGGVTRHETLDEAKNYAEVEHNKEVNNDN